MGIPEGSRFSRSREDRMNRAVKHVESLHRGNSLIRNGVEWAPDKEGDYEMWIMPYLVTKPNHPDLKDDDYTPGEEYFYRRPYAIHWINKKPYVCPKATFGNPCPICEEHDKYEWGTDEEKNLRTDKWVMYPVKIKGLEGYQVFNWKYSKFTKPFDEALEAEDDKSNLIFYEFEGGKTVKFKVKENKEKKFHYLEAKFFKFSDRKDLPESVIDEVPQLDECVEALSYDKLKSIFLGSIESIIEKDEEKPEVEKVVEKASVAAPKRENKLPPRELPKDEEEDSFFEEPVVESAADDDGWDD